MTFSNHLVTRVPTNLAHNFPKRIFCHLPKGYKCNPESFGSKYCSKHEAVYSLVYMCEAAYKKSTPLGYTCTPFGSWRLKRGNFYNDTVTLKLIEEESQR